MNMLAQLDYAIIVFYFVVISLYGYWVYKRKQSAEANSKDYFLAEGSLTWWAIGASLIASNISAEQFVGMSGEGFFLGIAIAAYEWIAAIALIAIAVWFMPIYLKNKIYTMPQFLKMRYNESVALIMAIFWLFLYVLVNLTSILYLGALAINSLVGGSYLHIIMIVLLVFATIITLGGMKVIGYTDVIQVFVLIVGGLVATGMALLLVSKYFGTGAGIVDGFNALLKHAPDHFHMIFQKPITTTAVINTPENLSIQKYVILPGIAMYLAGQWIVNLNYWGCNQYITQRALGADLQTARKGILFAALLKMMMPIIVMLPGIAAYVLYRGGYLTNFSGGKDEAYSAILSFLPTGFKGLAVAALTAAIVASLAGKANSISTIFTLDIYKRYVNKNASEKRMVWTGRLVIVVAMFIALALTWSDVLGIGGEGGFTFIQKYTGLISPGVFAMFILGLFWKRTTTTAAFVGLITGFLLAIFFNSYAIDLFGKETWLYTAFEYQKLEKGIVKTVIEIPFLINMGWSFFITIVIMILVSLCGAKQHTKAFVIEKSLFKLSPTIIIMISAILLIFSILYVRFW
jgi:solute:Na+ symporter, SSS family